MRLRKRQVPEGSAGILRVAAKPSARKAACLNGFNVRTPHVLGTERLMRRFMAPCVLL
jgi:hypothetical protein